MRTGVWPRPTTRMPRARPPCRDSWRSRPLTTRSPVPMPGGVGRARLGRRARGEPGIPIATVPTRRTGRTAVGRAEHARPVGRERLADHLDQRGSGRLQAHRGHARPDPSDRRTRQRSARRPTTVPRGSHSSPTGAERRGTGPRRGRTGRSIPRSTPIRASTDRSTRQGPAESCAGGMRRTGSIHPNRLPRPRRRRRGDSRRSRRPRAATNRRRPRIRPRRGGRQRLVTRPEPMARRPVVRAGAAREGPPARSPRGRPAMPLIPEATRPETPARRRRGGQP